MNHEGTAPCGLFNGGFYKRSSVLRESFVRARRKLLRGADYGVRFSAFFMG
jgi:hypothetical protein